MHHQGAKIDADEAVVAVTMTCSTVYNWMDTGSMLRGSVRVAA